METGFVTNLSLETWSPSLNGNTQPPEPPWVFDDINQRRLVAGSLAVIAVFGLTGNILTIMAVILSKRLHTIGNVFVVNLTIAGGLSCATLPFSIANMIANTDTGIIPPKLCTFVSLLSYFSFDGTIVSHALIAFDRYYRITKPNHKYHDMFTKCRITIFIVCAWLYANITVIIFATFAKEKAMYNCKYRVCLPDISNPTVAKVSLFRSVTVDLLILIFVSVCYSAIFIHIYRHGKELLGMSREVNATNEEQMSELSLATETPYGMRFTGGFNVPIYREEQLGSSDAFSSIAGERYRLSTQRQKPVDDMSSSRSETLDEHNTGDITTEKETYKDRVLHQNSTTSFLPREDVNLRTTLNARQVKITKNMFLVVALYVVCITPYVVCLSIDSFERLFPYVAIFFAMSNAINPVIYAWKHPNFKAVFKPMIQLKFSQIPEPSKILKFFVTNDKRRNRFS